MIMVTLSKRSESMLAEKKCRQNSIATIIFVSFNDFIWIDFLWGKVSSIDLISLKIQMLDGKVLFKKIIPNRDE